MFEDELVDRIRRRTPRTSLHFGDPEPPFAPAPLEAIAEAEGRIGFALPALLKRLYLEIGNGGFGPGYGLFGVKGGFADDVTGMTVEDLYREHQDWGDWWPTGLVPICDWGCTMGAAIDCTTPAADVVFIGDRSPLLMPQGVGFAAWMEDWGNGIDLFNPVYRRYQRFHPATPDEHS